MMTDGPRRATAEDESCSDVAVQPGRATSTERVARHRRRQREGLRLAYLEVRPNEIAFLMRQGFLPPGQEGDPWTLAHAVGRLLDLLMPELEAETIVIRRKQ
jgi:hypothetical protein